MKSKVAFIGTGGTIASLGRNSLDIIDYSANKQKLHADEMIAHVAEAQEIADIIPVRFRNISSTELYFQDWRELVLLCEQLGHMHPDLAGIVIGHGTATLEETAYFLNLTIKTPLPVVVVGSQRPLNGLSSDASLNLVNAIRVAADPASRDRGVLVLLNDEIQAAREVTKTSTARLQTFQSRDFGILGQVDGAEVSYYRRPERKHAPHTEFDVRNLEALPRVDISYAYAGADGAAVRGFLTAGAKGIISAGFAPGGTPKREAEALSEAREKGVVIVQATRAGSGRTARSTRLRELGFILADNLNPQKSRILLALALTVTRNATDIERIFASY